MPTYDYKCNACDHRFELFQSMSAKTQKKCPKCGKNALERLIGTGAALLFKGSGFYQTDYRSEGYKKSEQAEKPSPAKTEAGASKPADSAAKPPAKPESKPDAKPSPEKSKGPAKPTKD